VGIRVAIEAIPDHPFDLSIFSCRGEGLAPMACTRGMHNTDKKLPQKSVSWLIISPIEKSFFS